jgi:hypothetical protein
VLSEFAPEEGDVPVWIVDGPGNVRETTLRAPLPDDFGARHLNP